MLISCKISYTHTSRTNSLIRFIIKNNFFSFSMSHLFNNSTIQVPDVHIPNDLS